ncbi:MAG: D-alanyl-D-alanine carboxypeptidase family protein [Actinomycetota bacterium]|nr:D-alanyl-D-alanine carboxypeptidase family protein [Actinomycetota bacterium]
MIRGLLATTAGAAGVTAGVLTFGGAFSAEALTQIPERAAVAYMAAAASAPCDIAPADIAAVYEIEAPGHDGGGEIAPDGEVTPHIFGPALVGSSAAIGRVSDTDDGSLDGDSVHDRAVGPGQFIPQTWLSVRTDGDGDGVTDVHDIDDAAASTAVLLCRNGYDVTDDGARREAFRRYNGSGPAARSYAAKAMGIAAGYVGEQTPADVPTSLSPAGAVGLSDILDDLWNRAMGVRAVVTDTLDDGDTPTLNAAWTALNAPLDTYLDDLADGQLVVAGQAPSGDVVHRGGVALVELTAGCLVAPDSAPKYRSLIQAAAGDDVKLVPVSCYRSNDKQIELRRAHCGTSDYAVYRMPASDCTPDTARPGTSKHEVGRAVDFAGASTFGTPTGRWLTAHADEHGLHQISTEAWHIEDRGAPSSAADVAVLGDSLAVGLAAGDVRVLAVEEGRPAAWCAEQARRASWDGVAVVVISCGANDGAGLTERAVDDVLRAVPSSVEVRWVDLPATFDNPLNGLLEARGVRTIGWAAKTADEPDLLGGDGLHPTTAGYDEMANLARNPEA